jgi:transcription antitermination protein NusB
VSGSRRQGREAALQVLYLNDISRNTPREVPEPVWSAELLTPKTRAFAARLAEGVSAHQSAIDPLIKKYAENWEIARMATIDRCILRLAAYELVHELDTPINVIINEAVEIAKKFSTGESGKFVNGILDKIKLERGHGKSGS